jgi:hypothetical protein
MKTLKCSVSEFTDMLSGLIASGVTFEAVTNKGIVTITFTNGY